MSRKQEQSLEERMRAKDWRTLPQTVAFGDTRPTRRQRWRQLARAVAFIAIFGGILTMLGIVAREMFRDASEPIATRATEFEFVNDGGVLSENWFRERSGTTENRAPNLNEIRLRLASYPQIASVRVRRLPNDKIRVEIRERRPVARFVDGNGTMKLVADDGVIFPAETFPSTQAMLPILTDAKISRASENTDGNASFDRIEGIAPVVRFLELCRVRYKKLFAEWDTISLKDFPADPRDLAMPWSVFRVTPRATSRNPARAQISEIAFSTEFFAEDLKLLASADAAGTLDAVLDSAPAGKNFKIRFVTNKKNPSDEFREMRMIPESAGSL